jgi:hypothetical protein
MLVIALLVVACVLLFAAGVFAPRFSRRAQHAVDTVLQKGEREGDTHGGRAGAGMAETDRAAETAADDAARAGRKVHSDL